jgi:hypothetical protein
MIIVKRTKKRANLIVLSAAKARYSSQLSHSYSYRVIVQALYNGTSPKTKQSKTKCQVPSSQLTKNLLVRNISERICKDKHRTALHCCCWLLRGGKIVELKAEADCENIPYKKLHADTR